MKNNSITNNTYNEARAKWAKGQTEVFLSVLEQIGNNTGLKITPVQYVRAYKLCIEEFKFGYPTEYKITELIATEESYENVLAIMSEVMKRFRLAFQQKHKKQIEQMKKKAAHKKAA